MMIRSGTMLGGLARRIRRHPTTTLQPPCHAMAKPFSVFPIVDISRLYRVHGTTVVPAIDPMRLLARAMSSSSSSAHGTDQGPAAIWANMLSNKLRNGPVGSGPHMRRTPPVQTDRLARSDGMKRPRRRPTKSSRSHMKPGKRVATTLYEEWRQHRDTMALDEVHKAIKINARYHQDRVHGMANALEMAQWLATRGLAISAQAWSGVLHGMVELEFPVEEMTRWMDTFPREKLTKEMIYVLSETLDSGRKHDVVLDLLRHYLESTGPEISSEDRGTLVRHLANKFINGKPTIRQLEAFVACANNRQCEMTWGQVCYLASYYLDPLNHQLGRGSTSSIVDHFLILVKDNTSVLKWRSDTELSAEDPVDCEETSARPSLDQVVMMCFETLKEEEQDVYLQAAFGVVKDAGLLYEVAELRASDRFIPLDWDVYENALAATLTHRENEKIDLTKAIELSNWMALHGIPLKFKAWGTILLEMIRSKYPLRHLVHWMDTHQSKDLTRGFIYALSVTLDHGRKTAMALALVKHYLDQTGIDEPWKSRDAVLSFLLQKFLFAKPCIEHLEEFIACMTTLGSVATPLNCERIASYYLEPLNHGFGPTSHEIARDFIKFYDANASVLKHLSKEEVTKRVNALVQ